MCFWKLINTCFTTRKNNENFEQEPLVIKRKVPIHTDLFVIYEEDEEEEYEGKKDYKIIKEYFI